MFDDFVLTMPRLPRGKNPRKLPISMRKLREFFRRPFSKRELRDMVRPLARQIAREERYTLPEVIELLRTMKEKPKRPKGRPGTPNRFRILDLAAKARVEGRPYTRLAARFRLKPKQLTDLVHTNREYFDRKVKELRNLS